MNALQVIDSSLDIQGLKSLGFRYANNRCSRVFDMKGHQDFEVTRLGPNAEVYLFSGRLAVVPKSSLLAKLRGYQTWLAEITQTANRFADFMAAVKDVVRDFDAGLVWLYWKSHKMVTGTVEPGLRGFASHAKALEHATRHAGFDVYVTKDRIYAVYGEDVQAFVDLFLSHNKIHVSTYLECPVEDDAQDHTMLDNLTTETLFNGYITRMDTHRLPGYLEALKSNADSLHPDWRHGHQGFHELINHAKQVFK